MAIINLKEWTNSPIAPPHDPALTYKVWSEDLEPLNNALEDGTKGINTEQIQIGGTAFINTTRDIVINTLRLGDGALGTKTLLFNKGGNLPGIRYNSSTTKLERSDDGTTWKNFLDNPWTENIDGGGYDLSNVGNITVNTNIFATGMTSIGGVLPSPLPTTNSPRWKITEIGSSATPYYPGWADWSPHALYVLNNLSTPRKTGIYMECVNTDNTTAGAGETAGTDGKRKRANTGIIVNHYSYKDNGGDVSAIVARQWGEGNALTAIVEAPPPGLPTPTASRQYGFGIECIGYGNRTGTHFVNFDNGISQGVLVGNKTDVANVYPEGIRIIPRVSGLLGTSPYEIDPAANLDKRVAIRVTPAQDNFNDTVYDAFTVTLDGRVIIDQRLGVNTVGASNAALRLVENKVNGGPWITPEIQFAVGGVDVNGAVQKGRIYAAISSRWTSVADNTTGDIIFGTRKLTTDANLTESITVKGDGGLMLGAPTGGSKGAGTLNAQGDIYKNNTAFTNPDYVFEHWATGAIGLFASSPGAAAYTGIMALPDVEAHVRKNFSLPGISREPSGLFGRCDILLEKVEEIYLYLFEQAREIKMLKGRLAAHSI